MIVLHLCLIAASQLHVPTDAWEIGIFVHFVFAALYTSTLAWQVLVPCTLACAVSLFHFGKQEFFPLFLLASTSAYAIYQGSSGGITHGTSACLATDSATFVAQCVASRWLTPKTRPVSAKR